MLRLNQIELFPKITVPPRRPASSRFPGLGIGVGLSWLAMVAAEMPNGGAGIGFVTRDARNSGRRTDIVVAPVCIGMTGFIRDRPAGRIGRVVSRGTAG